MPHRTRAMFAVPIIRLSAQENFPTDLGKGRSWERLMTRGLPFLGFPASLGIVPCLAKPEGCHRILRDVLVLAFFHVF